MQIHQLVRKGEIHRDYCEDFILHADLDKQFTLFGVFDGCSSGTDSHFASALIAKVVRGELAFLESDDKLSMKNILETIVLRAAQTLKNLRNELLLETNELLSTIILLLVDKYANEGEIIVLGDGFVSINGKSTRIEQNNEPDYLAYYLDSLDSCNDFDLWLKNHSVSFHVEDIQDVSISTDGIDTFKKAEFTDDNDALPELIEYLTKDDYLCKNKSMLARKYNIIKRKYGYINQDDLAMVRVIKSDSLKKLAKNFLLSSVDAFCF